MKISEKYLRIVIKLLIAVIVLVVLGTAAFLTLQMVGRSRLYNKTKQSAPKLPTMELSETITAEEGSTLTAAENGEAASDYTWQEGDIRYQGTVYRYNEDVLTFLFMGIDKNSEVKTLQEGTKGGQADAMFLLVLNPQSKEASIIAIPRDTMAEIYVYNENGDYIGTSTAQLALQHGYGDGAAISCQRTVDAVSRLFYGLGISGYCSINMEAIPKLNDAVGGVEVEILEDIPGTKLKAGNSALLKGKDAYTYLRSRDTKSFGSAGKRLERQKQYLTAYAAKAMGEMKKDITLPVTLYNTLSKYMVTDVTIDEVSYLASQASGYHFDSQNMYSLAGETVMGEKFEEYYLDEDALYELILKVFYNDITP